MKPTAPLRSNFRMFYEALDFVSVPRFPSAIRVFEMHAGRAVLFSTIAVTYLFLVRP